MSAMDAAVRRRNQDLPSAVGEAEARYRAVNKESERLSKLAQGTLPGGNTRTTVHFSPFPLYISSGKGSRLTDVDGHSYADFVNEYTAGVFGHSNPVIAEAMTGALKGGINLGAPTRHEVAAGGGNPQALPGHGTAALLQFRAPRPTCWRWHRAGHHRQGCRADLQRRLSRQHSLFRHGGSPLNMKFDWVLIQLQRHCRRRAATSPPMPAGWRPSSSSRCRAAPARYPATPPS